MYLQLMLITLLHRPHNCDKAQWAQGGRPIWSGINVYTSVYTSSLEKLEDNVT
jgi:hypothetical protein